MYVEKARGAHTALYKGTSIDSRILHLADPDALTFLQPSHGIVILEIGTHWCVQCRLMRPFIEKTALEFTGSMLIADVNADDASLTMKHFGVDSFPQLLFFEDGQYRKRECGFRDYPSFRQPMLDSIGRKDPTELPDSELNPLCYCQSDRRNPSHDTLGFVILIRLTASVHRCDEAQKFLRVTPGTGFVLESVSATSTPPRR